jgi:hypothetical protein
MVISSCREAELLGTRIISLRLSFHPPSLSIVLTLILTGRNQFKSQKLIPSGPIAKNRGLQCKEDGIIVHIILWICVDCICNISERKIKWLKYPLVFINGDKWKESGCTTSTLREVANSKGYFPHENVEHIFVSLYRSSYAQYHNLPDLTTCFFISYPILHQLNSFSLSSRKL